METTVDSTYTDEQLLAALRKDNSLALGVIYERYYRHVYHFLLTLVKAPDAAEDLTHEVFIKIWDIRRKLRIDRSFKSYLLKVGHSKAIDLLRKMAAEKNVRGQLFYDSTPTGEGFTEADLNRFAALMDQALDSLTPQRRRLFELCKKQKKSYEEVAGELNISLNTVKAHMSQILALLRDFIFDRWQFSLLFVLLQNFF
ncbi:MAG TPA: sigma-70 family RNA polymerase sigma factor [Puia sp.]|jgi:RNA polymerase sigma-70 factor (ECF subfamily)